MTAPENAATTEVPVETPAKEVTTTEVAATPETGHEAVVDAPDPGTFDVEPKEG